MSAPADVSSSVGPPATRRRTFVSCARVAVFAAAADAASFLDDDEPFFFVLDVLDEEPLDVAGLVDDGDDDEGAAEAGALDVTAIAATIARGRRTGRTR